MTKLMIVEDDIALREIYSIRLTAEGYTIVVAGDGEEALAIAVREKPDLILSDVMMPKISGFDMLDIIRSTPELKDVKVVMMTALSSEEQRARGEALGADRYLVKSQVGIEDVVNVIHEVLGDKAAAPAAPAAPAYPGAPVTPAVPGAPAAANNPIVSPTSIAAAAPLISPSQFSTRVPGNGVSGNPAQ
jgi:DNA-binding response OmpR family regulator